jgi:hypothetical protein
MSTKRFLALAVAAIAMLGVFAIAQPRDAEADLITFDLNTNVVISGGFVIATITGHDDDVTNTASSNVYIYGEAPFVSPANQGSEPGQDFADGITPLTCVVGVDPCDPDPPDPANPEPQVCDFANGEGPGGGGVACVGYGDGALDTDTTQETFTATLQINITCDQGSDLVDITAGDQDSATTEQVETVLCLTEPNFIVTKDAGDDTTTEFEFIYTGSGCWMDDGVNPPVLLGTGDPFTLVGGQTAELFCGVDDDQQNDLHTVAETDPAPDAAFVSVTCVDPTTVTDQTARSATLSLVDNNEVPQQDADCTWVNEVSQDTDEDDPALPNIEVSKVCVGDVGDATFSIVVRATTQPIECDGEVTFADLDPGEVEVTEEIEGGEGIETLIACSDGQQVTGTSVTLTIPEPVEGEDAVDIFCVVVNSAEGLDDLICSCTCCGGLELDIDLNNTNTNTIGIDNSNTNNNANDNDNLNENFNENENKNDNKNENTQNQENTQDQSNENSQTNNITSSPEVNIDFDE